MCCLHSQRDYMEWKAVTTSISRQDRSPTSKQGSKFFGRPPFFGNMVYFTADDSFCNFLTQIIRYKYSIKYNMLHICI